MKLKHIILLCTAYALLIMQGCVGDLPEEQFDKFVLLTKNGWVEQDVEFTASNKVVIPISISISGTSVNKEEVQVVLQYDIDLLEYYNLEKYKLQTGLYYTAIPENAIQFNDRVTVASGEDKAVSELTIDFDKITDPYKDYVIPISIKEISKYSMQELEPAAVLKRSEAMLHINRINSFSGNYAGDASVFKTNRTLVNTGDGTPVPIKTFYALSENECYFYAGQIDRNYVNRNDYIVKIKIEEDGTVTMNSPNSELELTQEIAGLQTLAKPVISDARYEMVNKTFTFSYTYFNIDDDSEVTNNNNHILRCQGLILRERKELIKN